ncbi:UNVERIFIED_CONTAM: hypothetical protein Scaly_2204200 [Sesamum calycinum]|uniref:Mitochondrial protein n=1 Tax=Sesamum calycinum TaxID=2727403 RepID=A0AAW2MRF1_9LAMI
MRSKKSKVIIQPPLHQIQVINLKGIVALEENDEPLNFEEAIKGKKWIHAMEEEILSIEKNDTWEIATLPNGDEAIGVKWVFKIKRNAK